MLEKNFAILEPPGYEAKSPLKNSKEKFCSFWCILTERLIKFPFQQICHFQPMFGPEDMKDGPRGVTNAWTSYNLLKIPPERIKNVLWVIMVSLAKPLRGYIVCLYKPK